MVRKRYRQMTAILMAAIMSCSTVMVQAAEGTTETTEVLTEAPAETKTPEAQTQEALPPTEAQTQETSQPAETEPVTDPDDGAASNGEGAGETLPESETTGVTEKETEKAEMTEPGSETAGTEEPDTESSEAPESSSEVTEAPGSRSADVEMTEAGSETSETNEAESDTEEKTKADAEDDGETEPDSKTKESETETEDVKLRMTVLDEAGVPLNMEEIIGPDTLTCNGITHPADYMDGVYHVQVPYGTESIQFQIQEPEGVTDAELTKWSGYLVENESTWFLCPDDPMENTFTRAENLYTVALENYQLELTDLTMEQIAVYGSLSDEYSYAEVFICSPEVSTVVLVEIEKEEEAETELAAENETAAETEAVTEVIAETEISTEEVLFEIVEEVVMEVMPLAASPQQIQSTYEATGENLADSAKEYVPKVSAINGEWQILGLARSEQEVDADLYDKYVNNVVNTVTQKEGVLHAKKYTEYSRVILALTSIGADVTNVGGYNLLEPLADFDQTVWQGINGAIFALIAFDSHDYEIPTAAAGKTQTTRVKLINHILSLEISGGGWALSGSSADTDVTAMAIQALAPYYSSSEPVKKAVDRAVAKLSAMQMDNGGYGSWNVINSESCSQVIVALTALGIDPNTDSRFVKNGNSVVDALLGFSTSDGAFKHETSGSADQMATEQAYYALTSYQRFKNGQTSLYDMSDVPLQSDYKKAGAAETLIQALPENITLQDKAQVQAALAAYNNLNTLQKSLVSEAAYSKLQAAVKTLEELDAALGTEKESEQQTESETETEKETEAESEAITEKNTDTDSDKETEKDKNTGNTNKKPSGTTKQVNLVSSSNRTGSTSSTRTVSSTRTSVSSKADEEETETESETEKKNDKKTGNTQMPDSVKDVITGIGNLFRDTKTSKKLPEQASDYSDAQIESIVAVYRSYEMLTGEEKETVEKSAKYNEYLAVLDKVKAENHYDETTGTDLRDNEEETLPWYISLEVVPQLIEESQLEFVKTALKGQGEMFTLNDIHLLDQKDGGEWQPEDLVRVSIPMTDIGTYENVAIVHMKDDGTMEFIEAHISGSNLEFDTDSFSRFGIVGFHGSMEELMQEQEEETFWIYLVPGVGAALLLVLLLMIRLSGSKKKRV